MTQTRWSSGFMVCVAFAAGWWMHSGHAARAQSSHGDAGEVYFQLQGVNQGSALTLYYPGEHTIYVYQGATTGNAAVQCAFKYELGNKPGGVVRRTPCPVPKLNP